MIATIKFKFQEWRREREVRRLYLHDPLYRTVEKAFHRAYRFCNPYACSRKFLEERGEKKIHLYGETPLATAEKIGKGLGLSEKETLFDLGAGRGRASLFFKHHFKCRVVAIEEVPLFVVKGLKLGLEMRREDYFESDLSEATAIYLYGTSLTRAEIKSLSYKLRDLPKRPKIATTSYPLSDYDGAFEILERFEGEFPWGNTEIYINRRR